MKIFKRALLGCLLIGVAGLVIVAATAAILVALGPPESRPETTASGQNISTPPLPPAASPAPLEVSIPPRFLEVDLSLVEGKFRVLRGQTGNEVRVEAAYDAGVYSLEQEHEPGSSGAERVVVRFYPRYSMLRRLLTMEKIDPGANRVTIYLPADVPLRLKARISRGESELDLSGLALTGLDLDLSMGEHELSIRDPNPLVMDELRLRFSKGELDATGLGNARFRRAIIETSMGEVDLDLRGDYSADAAVQAHHSMGEMTIVLPRDARVDLTNASVFFGEKNVTAGGEDNALPDDTPTVKVDASLSFGELTVRRR